VKNLFFIITKKDGPFDLNGQAIREFTQSYGHNLETFIGQEWLAYSDPSKEPHLYYWHREQRTSVAQVYIHF